MDELLLLLFFEFIDRWRVLFILCNVAPSFRKGGQRVH